MDHELKSECLRALPDERFEEECMEFAENHLRR